MGNSNYDFSTFSSNILIFGGAILGVIFLLLEYVEKQKNRT
ncbi:hypothetical protein D1BOALGB6SA_8332 [Olavius sp. associated proteobacterium Delta 1]|nr:hypothetical protein D1BOALGB6SA_8332 [Olavius sp. associated proteobacterium Delta 1]